MKAILKKSWWVFVLVGAFSGLYFHGMREKALVLQDLQVRLRGLEQEKLLAQQQKQELMMEIESQSDPAWIELRLMEELGMTPQGSVKVYFNHP